MGQQESDTTEHTTWGSCLPTTPEVMQVSPFALGQGCSSQGQDDGPDIPVLNGLWDQQRMCLPTPTAGSVPQVGSAETSECCRLRPRAMHL